MIDFLMHQLKFGNSAERIRKMASRTGATVNIPDPPVLTFRQQRLLTAFSELSTDRSIGMAEGPIPWSSIRRYAHEYGFCLEDLSDVIRRVDGAYLAYQRKKTASHGNAQSPVSQPSGVRKSSRKAR